MKISSFLNYYGDFEERKRILQRKEMNNAYKKNATYTQKDKNSMLEILKSLLSGKTEKELFEQPNDSEQNQDNLLEKNVRSIKASDDNNEIVLSSPDRDGLKRVVKDVQQTIEEIAISREENNNRNSNLFSSYLQDWYREVDSKKGYNQITFGKGLENILDKRAFDNAAINYKFQMKMAQNGFRLNQSRFSITV